MPIFEELSEKKGKRRLRDCSILPDLPLSFIGLAGALSGGMKQKLGLACALVKKPTLLLLDEPSVGVDPMSRRELWKMVSDIIPEGISVVWSTAYLDEAEKCHTVLLINAGKASFSWKT